MPYTASPRKVVRVLRYLKDMLDSNVQLEWTHERPVQLAYWIREAMAAAARNEGEPYEQFAALKAKFIIRVVGTKVVAEPRVPTFTASQGSLAVINLPGLTSALEIIGAAVNHRKEKMYFPDGTATVNELAPWAAKNGYEVLVSSTGITLVKGESIIVPEILE
jgi:hypothetical protein